MKIFRKYFILTVLCSLALSNNSNFNLISKTNDKVVISFEIDNLSYIDEGDYTKINNSKLKTIDKGLPELPKYTFNYGIDPSKTYEVTYKIKDSHLIEGINLYPYQDEQDKANNMPFFEDSNYFLSWIQK